MRGQRGRIAAISLVLAALSCTGGTVPPEAFAHSGSAFAVSDGRRLGTLPFSPRRAAFASDGRGYLAFDHEGRRLVLLNAAFLPTKAVPLEAVYAWVSPALVLAQGETWETPSGFRFSLLARGPGDSFREKSAWNLDCFVSDVAFRKDGTIAVAGSSKDGKERSVWSLAPGTQAVKRLSVRDVPGFLRLVDLDGELIVFMSSKDKKNGWTGIWEVKNDGSASEARVTDLPEEFEAWYGSGFQFLGLPRLPAAMKDGGNSIVTLERSGDSEWKAVRVTPGSGGVYAPLGEHADRFSFLAFDYFADRNLFRFGAFDGNAATLSPLR